MVQEIAKKLIRMGEKGRSSGSLLHSSEGGVPSFYEGGRREALCAVLPFEEMTAIISHFKFVAGMNVGEKRRSS